MTWLAAHKIYAWRNNTGAFWTDKRPVFYGKKGSGDIIGVLPGGRFLSVEVKVGRNKPSIHQIAFAERVIAWGGLAITVYSVAELEEKINDNDKRQQT